MILEPCTCPWDIPGVWALPPHSHPQCYVGEPGKGHLVPDIYIWVDWKQVARDLTVVVPRAVPGAFQPMSRWQTYRYWRSLKVRRTEALRLASMRASDRPTVGQAAFRWLDWSGAA